jgi:hypothetical protein
MSSDLQRLLDRQEIIDLIHTISRNVDLGMSGIGGKEQEDAILELLTDDCALDFGPDLGGPMHGRESLRESFRSDDELRFAATRHMLSNIQVTFETDDQAHGTTYVYAWHRFADGSPDAHLYGQYRDVFVRADGRWRIANRRLEVAGVVDFPLKWNPISP